MGKKTGIEGAVAPLPAAATVWWQRKKIPGSRGEVDWVKIAVVSYHTTLVHELPSEISCTALWEHWPVVAAFEDVLKGMVDAHHPGITEGTSAAIMRWAYQTATQGLEVTPRENPITEGGGGLSLYVVEGPYTTVRKYALRYLDEVANDAKEVGGDDDYFDYYPDRVYCALQLAIPLNLGELYGEAYEKIMIRYAELEPDVIPTWEDTAPKEVDA